ncbi:LPP20 family lipoprotein [Catenovulum sediminis]|uniref:LPP20 family lipoprotein n=1 Tax=Catenovulum sediminis TaxID=1740262 RepID=A0ABV1RDU9_9ALTE
MTKFTGFLAIAVALISFTSQANNQAFQSGVMEATGFGTVDMSKVANKVQARFMAKRAAQVDAQRNLAEQIRGIRLTAGTTVEDYEVTSDVIATRVKGTLEGAFIIDSKLTEEDGTYVAEVKVGVCMNAQSSQCRNKQNLKKALVEVYQPAAQAKVEEVFTAPVENEPQTVHSAFILDASKQPYTASLVTKVYTNDGKLVLSSKDFESHQTKSLVWSANAAEFDSFNPKLVKVERIVNGSDLIISESDAKAILANVQRQAMDGLLVIVSE